MVFLIATLTILAWGLWLLPECYAARRVPTVTVFYATLANLIAALVVQLVAARAAAPVSPGWHAAIFAGGLVWAGAGICAFLANRELGLARAVGFRTPINILVSLAWGALLFSEFARTAPAGMLALAAATAALIAGLVLISGGPGSADDPSPRSRLGWASAAAAGILWGSYYLPIRWGEVSPWTAALPLAAGMWIGALGAVLARGDSLRLPHRRDYALLALCGLLWAVGNYGSLFLMEAIGPGRGFALAQLCLAVNALAGIYVLRSPAPGTPGARRTLLGCGLSGAGGAVLGLVQ